MHQSQVKLSWQDLEELKKIITEEEKEINRLTKGSKQLKEKVALQIQDLDKFLKSVGRMVAYVDLEAKHRRFLVVHTPQKEKMVNTANSFADPEKLIEEILEKVKFMLSFKNFHTFLDLIILPSLMKKGQVYEKEALTFRVARTDEVSQIEKVPEICLAIAVSSKYQSILVLQ
ncbi:hypothetical protein L2E82_37341 [Cichorium intybus]|uniref:Uncharacterized protein n=1 Tax=Cichorium intybus TaxID=13427 RepID=A0ACB9AFP6_CICIN|nr:hypothetical protein L2E82_37341 [Cichorium intybus]